jgi:hypothetical protein
MQSSHSQRRWNTSCGFRETGKATLSRRRSVAVGTTSSSPDSNYSSAVRFFVQVSVASVPPSLIGTIDRRGTIVLSVYAAFFRSISSHKEVRPSCIRWKEIEHHGVRYKKKGTEKQSHNTPIKGKKRYMKDPQKETR